MFDTSVGNTPRIKFWLHIILALFIVTAFMLTIARIANKGSARGRSTSYGIPVTVKGAIFLAYQVLTQHIVRLQRWRSAKAYMILNYIETIFWAMLFGLSVQGSLKGCKGSACTLAGILATISLFGCFVAGLLAFVCTRAWLFFRRHGYHPGTIPLEEEDDTRMHSTLSTSSTEKVSVDIPQVGKFVY